MLAVETIRSCFIMREVSNICVCGSTKTYRMPLLVVVMLAGCSSAPTVPKTGSEQAEQLALEILKQSQSTENRNWLVNRAVNTLVNQTINYLQLLINNGSELFGLPPLDPLSVEHFSLNIPTGLINLVLELEDVHATGFGRFETQRSNLDISSLAFEFDISVPRVEIRSKYDLSGDLFTAITLFGKGDAEFSIENFSFGATFYLKQSDARNSVIIDRVEDIRFDIPHFESNLTGVIGGSDIDEIVNEVIEEVITDYVSRFRGAIAVVAGHALVSILNPILNQLDTWRYLAPFV